ncbi:hypothetical protein NTH_02292 [Nitratireductor thuwali]|uniref:Uncharacterized protein n=1 Tax=Nitratireductor thuwali TaxID=2267699 RepID=A0ABY5MPP3_9HYPH|nr:hypothetical protein NTH_02292 [Nitratireductor thuwali]
MADTDHLNFGDEHVETAGVSRKEAKMMPWPSVDVIVLYEGKRSTSILGNPHRDTWVTQFFNREPFVAIPFRDVG